LTAPLAQGSLWILLSQSLPLLRGGGTPIGVTEGCRTKSVYSICDEVTPQCSAGTIHAVRQFILHDEVNSFIIISTITKGLFLMLTSKQRANLRKQANSIDTIFQIGKDGVGENLVQQLLDALEARELIKIRVLENALMTPREASDIVCEATGADPVQVIGTRFVIYKRSEKNPRIEID